MKKIKVLAKITILSIAFAIGVRATISALNAEVIVA